MFKRIMTKYNLSPIQAVIVFIVFGITGSTAGYLSGPISDYLKLETIINPFLYWPIRLLILFPIYQVLLIFFGYCFDLVTGVFIKDNNKFIFNFFYKMAVNMIKGMLRLISFGQLLKK
ncbi:diacylglyceryl transferase [Flavobacteriaceae bacterium]|nr:diacylglyceryl transferase [Flavobacteriaceae bacterium]MDC1491903.1 diacylglyceryl transferase [Flavobacteriaceae bacterium]